MTTTSPTPDDERFRQIVAGFEDDFPPSAASPSPAPSPAPRPVADPPTRPIPAAPGPGTALRAAPVAPVAPHRPELVAPTEPEQPDLGHSEKIGKWASGTGYVMSILVGAFGQIMFFATWLAGVLGEPGNWIAAVIGAAFAEVAMIGAGTTSLIKRRDGGTWRLLLGVACAVCAGAVTLQVVHWAPKGIGLALVFGAGSVIGFAVHMVIEHSKLADHEAAQHEYALALQRYRREQQLRYEADQAAYERALPPAPAFPAAALPAANGPADSASSASSAAVERGGAGRTSGQARGAGSRRGARSARKATPGRAGAGNRPTKDIAVRIGVDKRAATPAPLREALTAAGYALPSQTSIETWCREIKRALAA